MSSSRRNDKERATSSHIIHTIMQGDERIVSHPGTSQFWNGGKGTSACGLAALNCARITFRKQAEGLQGDALLQDICNRETMEEINSICAFWASNRHLEVEDIFRVPLFDTALKLVRTEFNSLNIKHFKNLLLELQRIRTSAAVVITRPPEIVTCMKLLVSTTSVFVIFDSHPRPTYPDGAGLIFNTSIDATAARLNKLLAVDSRILSDATLQWQAQLLAQYSGHIFVSRTSSGNVAALNHALLDSSLTILALQAEVSDLKFQNTSLVSENKRLEVEIDEWEEKEKRRQRLMQRPQPTSPYANGHQTRALQSVRSYSNAVAGPSGSAGHSSNVSPASHTLSSPSIQPHTDHQVIKPHTLTPPTSDQIEVDDDSLARPRLLQRQFDEEDLRLRAEHKALVDSTQRTFNCSICMEDRPDDYVARIVGCGHSFCRACILRYIGSKLGDNRFPILCPVCATGSAGKEPGVITSVLAQEVGITEEQYETWTELEMVAFSVVVHCRKCKQSVFVDRKDYQETAIIVCPLRGCNSIWCKSCQQKITIGGPQHSCDGSSELDHLVKQRGWKYCPGCNTPIQKSDGCNHMACMSPGCNTHFCYTCGEAIIRSARRHDIKSASSAHYRRCKLFEIPA